MKCLPAACFAALLSVFSTIAANAQDEDAKYEFGVNLGMTVYQGDLTPNRFGSTETQKFAFGLHASRLISPAFSVRGNLLVSRLTGDESIYDEPEYRQERNFRFTTPLTELTVQLAWNPLRNNFDAKGFSPYLFAGAGIAFVRIDRDASRINKAYFPTTAEIWTGLSADSAQALPRVMPVVPVGGGVKYFFTEKFGVNLEASYRLTFTDYLDGFSKSVGPEHNDHFLNYAIGVVFRSGSKNRMGCPTFRY